MSKLNSLLMGRFRQPKQEKIEQLANRINESQSNQTLANIPLTSTLINNDEKQSLKTLLELYQTADTNIETDLHSLSILTSEIKSINNQAIVLHGERVKRAQNLLKKYKDGIFSQWLINTYGNRQTPYNFLQYYELHETLSKQLQENLHSMPRQVIYTLASRSISQEEKVVFIKNYQGETKTELLEKLRSAYPLNTDDKRTPNTTKSLIQYLEMTIKQASHEKFLPSHEQKTTIKNLIQKLQESIIKW